MKRSIVTLFSASCLLAAPVLAQDLKGRGYVIDPVNDHVSEAVSEGLQGGAAF